MAHYSSLSRTGSLTRRQQSVGGTRQEGRLRSATGFAQCRVLAEKCVSEANVSWPSSLLVENSIRWLWSAGIAVWPPPKHGDSWAGELDPPRTYIGLPRASETSESLRSAGGDREATDARGREAGMSHRTSDSQSVVPCLNAPGQSFLALCARYSKQDSAAVNPLSAPWLRLSRKPRRNAERRLLGIVVHREVARLYLAADSKRSFSTPLTQEPVL